MRYSSAVYIRLRPSVAKGDPETILKRALLTFVSTRLAGVELYLEFWVALVLFGM